MSSSFYLPDGHGFMSTEYTRGPWDARYQHAGPPAALMARAIEHLDGGEGFSVSRFTKPVGEWVGLDARTRIDRHGVGLATSILYDASGRIGTGNQTLLVGPRAG